MVQQKIINIGACRNKKDPSKTGGVVVLFEAWVDYCSEQETDAVTIDSNKANYANRLVAYLSIIWQFLREVRSCTIVMLHGTANDYLLIAPIVVFISNMCKKKIVLRKFAGNFEEVYKESNRVSRLLYNYALRHAHLLFWETKSLVAFGKTINDNSFWFPNVRKRAEIRRDAGKPFSRRFVFLSRIEKMKGIDLLKDCFSSLPTDYHIDMYGPINGYEISALNGTNYSYQRAVEPSEVSVILSQYDVLILPTLWMTEGYPGVIIEGYGVGIPSIASRIGAIPEIVDDGKTGLLVDPGNVEELKQAILSIDNENYKEMANNALKVFEQFDSEEVNNHIMEIIQRVKCQTR